MAFQLSNDSIAGEACGAVMLIGFGGPTEPAEIRPFLDRVLAGRPVPRDRYEAVVHHYEVLGGRSPYNDLTARQALALREMLDRAGAGVPVVVGLRNAPPFIEDAIRDLAARGVTRALGLVLAAHRCEASWERYQADVEGARARIGAAAPAIVYPPPWHANPRFIAAVADRTRDAIARLAPAGREGAELIFTAHSIPLAMAARAPYVAQLEVSAALTAAALGRARWRVGYQSRSGSPRDPWLEPDVAAILRELKGRAAVVVPIGFLCDHVEVLYDLDVEAAAAARDAGVTMVRAATVGDHSRFIDMMAAIARPYLSPPPPLAHQG